MNLLVPISLNLSKYYLALAKDNYFSPSYVSSGLTFKRYNNSIKYSIKLSLVTLVA